MSSIPSLSFYSYSPSASGSRTHDQAATEQPNMASAICDTVESMADAQAQRRKDSDERNSRMRQLLRQWGISSDSPKQCRQVQSNWSRFSANRENRRSKDQMTMSALWTAKPIASGFNPPIDERVYLGVDQQEPLPETLRGPVPHSQPIAIPRSEPRTGLCDNHLKGPQGIVHIQRRRKPVLPKGSWSTISTDGDSESGPSEAMPFKRRPVKPVSTTSLLTRQFRRSEPETAKQDTNPVGWLSRAMGESVMSADMLPSAFDSDSSDGEEDEKADGPEKVPTTDINPVGYFARVMGQEVSVDMLPSAFSDSEEEPEGD